MDRPDCWTELARYVVPDLLPNRARTSSYDTIAADPLSGRSAHLDDVWSQFTRLNIPYQHPPWVAGGVQRLRDPELVLAEGGTCIDLVLTFAAMCLAADLRPYLVVDPAFTPEEGHALIGVDLATGINVGRGSIGSDSDVATGDYIPPLLTRAQLRRNIDNGSVELLDCTNAALDLGLGLASRGVEGRKDAGRFARSFLQHESTGDVDEWTKGIVAVVDIVAVQRTRTPYSELDRSKRAAITGHLPAAPPWLSYPKREELIDDVLAGFSEVVRLNRLESEPQEEVDSDGSVSDRAWTILVGPAGTGKSRLAHEVATRFESGAAWWLTSNDERTLRRSLAAAQASETGRTIKGTDMLGRDEETDAALARLRTSAMPWLVVLDNANCTPANLGRSRPRPRVELGQRALVTTLSEYEAAWRKILPNARYFTVVPLSDDDLKAVGSTLSKSVRDAAGGSALLVGAYTSLQRIFGDDLEEKLAATSGNGAERLWKVLLELGTDEEIEAAHRLSWLPPDGLPAQIIGPMVGRLSILGVLTQSLVRSASEPLYDLHREIGRAARSTDPTPVEHVISLLENAESFDYLDRFGDTETLDEMANVLLPVHREGRSSEGLGPALVYLARLFELYGRVVARGSTRSAEEMHIEASQRDDVQGLLLAECLHGRARAVNQDNNRNSPVDQETGETDQDHARRNAEREGFVDGALVMIEEAKTLRAGDAKLVARSDAVLGLLQQKKARFLPPDERANALVAAYGVLMHSRDVRVEIIRDERRSAGVDDETLLDLDPEIARARFNLAGAANDIARALPVTDPEGRSHYLDEARNTYEEVLNLRRAIYGTSRPHPHIVACIRGLGLIAYQRSWLVDAGKESRVASLRASHAYLTQAMSDDELLDFEDGTDVAKTLLLIAKAAERRLLLSAGRDQLSSMRSQADTENA